VEVLREAVAPAFPMFRAGDVLLSLRNLDTLVVADGRTWRIKWAMTGPFLGQHDPDFLPNGHLMVFDNRGTGDRPAFGLGHQQVGQDVRPRQAAHVGGQDAIRASLHALDLLSFPVVLSAAKDLTSATRLVSDRSVRSFAALRMTRMGIGDIPR
jgi:hypothetical protein